MTKVQWLVPLRIDASVYVIVDESTPESVVEEIAKDQISLVSLDLGVDAEIGYVECAGGCVRTDLPEDEG